MRRFFFQRDEDVSGASGTGIVVHGIEFQDGTCVVHWLGQHPSTVVWNSIEDAMYVHGHDGKTRLVWVDAEAPSEYLLRTLAHEGATLLPYVQPTLPGFEDIA